MTGWGGERIVKIGAYATAVLIHVPLVFAVQAFGNAVAVKDRRETVVTMMETPRLSRLASATNDTSKADVVAKPAIPRKGVEVDEIGAAAARRSPSEAATVASRIEAPSAPAIAPSLATATISAKAVTPDTVSAASPPQDVASLAAEAAATPAERVASPSATASRPAEAPSLDAVSTTQIATLSSPATDAPAAPLVSSAEAAPIIASSSPSAARTVPNAAERAESAATPATPTAGAAPNDAVAIARTETSAPAAASDVTRQPIAAVAVPPEIARPAGAPVAAARPSTVAAARASVAPVRATGTSGATGASTAARAVAAPAATTATPAVTRIAAATTAAGSPRPNAAPAAAGPVATAANVPVSDARRAPDAAASKPGPRTVTAVVASTTGSAASSQGATRPAAIAPRPPIAAAARVAAVSPSTGPVGLAPAGTANGSATSGSPSGTGTEEAVADFARGYRDDGCFVALSSQVSADRFALSGFSRDETAWLTFNTALESRVGFRLTTPSRRVSEAQCATLGFARRQPTYPDFKVRLKLDDDRLPNGGSISGSLEGVGEAPVTLLLVDDEGRVQDATAILGAPRDGRIAFSTPLTLTAGPVATVQLLVALTGEDATPENRPLIPVPAELYFRDLEQTLLAGGRGLDIAIAAFTVE